MVDSTALTIRAGEWHRTDGVVPAQLLRDPIRARHGSETPVIRTTPWKDNMNPNDIPIFDDSESPVLNPHGDVYAILESAEGDHHLVPLAHLVCETHVGPQPTPAHVPHHKDGDRTNNRADNLEWRIPAMGHVVAQHYRLVRRRRAG